jgi:hypothetical protein
MSHQTIASIGGGGMSEPAWEAVNLVPAITGLPMTVFASPRGRARHAARIKVHRRHGAKMDPSNTATVGLEPVPYPVPGAGELTERDAALVYQWAALNRAALVDYWNGRINTAELLARLERLP